MNLNGMDIRDVFFNEVYEVARKDPSLVFLTDDMDAFALKKFREDLPSQYINIGVAEQNMVNMAAGLAMCGKRVFIYGICTYVTLRCFEQIKLNLCAMNLPVTIVGVGAGFSFGFDGPSHHGIQDIAVMRTLPEITIYNPGDLITAKLSVQWAHQNKGPSYVRLDKGKFPCYYKEDDDFSKGYRVVRKLADCNIVSTGFMTSQVVRLSEQLETKSISVGVVDVFRLKPIANSFVSDVIDRSKKIVSLEENSIVGGLGSLISEFILDHSRTVPLKRIAAEDKHFIDYGSRGWFHKINKLDPETLLNYLSH